MLPVASQLCTKTAHVARPCKMSFKSPFDQATPRLTAVAVRRHQENSRSGRIWWQCRPRRTEEAKAQLEACKAGSSGRESRARDDTRDEGDVRVVLWHMGLVPPPPRAGNIWLTISKLQ